MSFSRDLLNSWFEGEGLQLLGVVTPNSTQAFERFNQWLDEGRHASMSFLERNSECREDPTRLLPGSQSVIVFGLPYYQGDTLEEALIGKNGPRVAQYARFADYHRELRKRGDRIGAQLKEAFPESQFRTVVDSAPLLERDLAAKTSEGFIGKNTCYIHPEKGSFYLLGEILSSKLLPIDEPAVVDPDQHLPTGGCGKCDRCQVNCPTGALNTDYSIDSNLCLAYWTIEHRGTIPEKFWPWLRLYYFGCDLCQLACPYNRGKTLPGLPSSLVSKVIPSLFEIATMDQNRYESWFGGTPLTRAKRGGLRRNALIAMKVTSDPKLHDAMRLCQFDSESPIAETLVQIENYTLQS